MFFLGPAYSGAYVRVRCGAIAQLGERLLCKQEVVGSIPSGSTTSWGCSSEKWISSRRRRMPQREVPLNDIVKRQAIRTSAQATERTTFIIGQFIGARAPVNVPSIDTHILGWFAKQAGLFKSELRRSRFTRTSHRLSEKSSAEGWASTMRAIKCLKGIWWMPWR